jgi:hypothetical protein
MICRDWFKLKKNILQLPLMKKLLLPLLSIILTTNAFGQIASSFIPLIVRADTAGCIVTTEMGRQFFTFENITDEKLSILQLAYPKEVFIAASQDQEKAIKKGIQSSFSIQSPQIKPTQSEIARLNKRTGNLYQAGENLQVSMLLMFGASLTGTSSSLLQVPELLYASVGLSITAIIVQWNVGTKLKRAAKDLSSEDSN